MKSESNWIMTAHNTSLFGRVGIVVCWHWDGSGDDKTMRHESLRAIELLPQLFSGETLSFSAHDWSLLFEALAMYPHRDDQMERLCEIAYKGSLGKNQGNTECFANCYDLAADPYAD